MSTPRQENLRAYIKSCNAQRKIFTAAGDTATASKYEQEAETFKEQLLVEFDEVYTDPEAEPELS